eukprot:1817159-Pyramimonas_sp.AAC.1
MLHTSGPPFLASPTLAWPVRSRGRRGLAPRAKLLNAADQLRALSALQPRTRDARARACARAAVAPA